MYEWPVKPSEKRNGKEILSGGVIVLLKPNETTDQVANIWRYNQDFTQMMPAIFANIKNSELINSKVSNVHQLVETKLELTYKALRKRYAMDLDSIGLARFIDVYHTEFAERLQRVGKHCAEFPFVHPAYQQTVRDSASFAAETAYSQVADIQAKRPAIEITPSLLKHYHLSHVLTSEVTDEAKISAMHVPMIESRDRAFKHFVVKMQSPPDALFTQTPLFMATCGYSQKKTIQPGDFIVCYSLTAKKHISDCLPEGWVAETWGYVNAEGKVEMAWSNEKQIYRAPIESLPSQFGQIQIFRKRPELLTQSEQHEQLLQFENTLLKECTDAFIDLLCDQYKINPSKIKSKKEGVDEEHIHARVDSRRLKMAIEEFATQFTNYLSLVFECTYIHPKLTEELIHLANELGIYFLENASNRPLLQIQIKHILFDVIRKEVQLICRRQLLELLVEYDLIVVTELPIESDPIPTQLESSPSPAYYMKLDIPTTTATTSSQCPLESESMTQVPIEPAPIEPTPNRSSRKKPLQQPLHLLPENPEFTSERLAQIDQKLAAFTSHPMFSTYLDHMRAWALANYEWDKLSAAYPYLNPELVVPTGEYRFRQSSDYAPFTNKTFTA
ncbi:MAG: hypothetical protein S4CHLAM102_15930 [Chlamydiia bacterium]|nr:hypothetical protein [Chlamydiia bacterium]